MASRSAGRLTIMQIPGLAWSQFAVKHQRLISIIDDSWTRSATAVAGTTDACRRRCTVSILLLRTRCAQPVVGQHVVKLSSGGVAGQIAVFYGRRQTTAGPLRHCHVLTVASCQQTVASQLVLQAVPHHRRSTTVHR